MNKPLPCGVVFDTGLIYEKDETLDEMIRGKSQG